jgi:hypothetical protein
MISERLVVSADPLTTPALAIAWPRRWHTLGSDAIASARRNDPAGTIESVHGPPEAPGRHDCINPGGRTIKCAARVHADAATARVRTSHGGLAAMPRPDTQTDQGAPPTAAGERDAYRRRLADWLATKPCSRPTIHRPDCTVTRYPRRRAVTSSPAARSVARSRRDRATAESRISKRRAVREEAATEPALAITWCGPRGAIRTRRGNPERALNAEPTGPASIGSGRGRATWDRANPPADDPRAA